MHKDGFLFTGSCVELLKISTTIFLSVNTFLAQQKKGVSKMGALVVPGGGGGAL